MPNRRLDVLYNSVMYVTCVALLSPFVSAIAVTLWREVWGK